MWPMDGILDQAKGKIEEEMLRKAMLQRGESTQQCLGSLLLQQKHVHSLLAE